MFESLQPAKPDAILGLTEAFKKDPNPAKINLSVGVYKDGEGKTPVLASVKQAEARLLEHEASKGYLPMTGLGDYTEAVRALLLGEGHEAVTSGRAATVQTPGGTGALRVAGDFITQKLPGRKLWLSDPTWPNHPAIFTAAGLELATYPYFDAATHSLNFDAMMETLGKAAPGDVVVLHGCCHNPTGQDLNAAQWRVVGDLVAERGLLPLVDFAYQGFAEGIESDAVGARELAGRGFDMLVATSYSKNFSLYNERVGALTLIAADPSALELALGHVKLAVRTNYSNPPSHGAAIVATILADADLRKQWEGELTAMRERINGMRNLFVRTMSEKAPGRDFEFIRHQRGMFSFSGLNPAQVEALRSHDAIYMVGSGRINVAGMTEANMEALCTAIARVLAD